MNKLKFLFVIAALVIGGGNVAWAGTKTVYLAPGVWNTDGAWFAMKMSKEGLSDNWVAFGELTNNICSATFDDTYDKVTFYRLKPSNANGYSGDNSGLNSTNKWNSLSEIDAPVSDNQLYVISGWNSTDYYIIPYDWRAGGTFYLYNVGAGKYMCSGKNWGTNAIVGSGGFPLTFERNDGSFRLKTSAIYNPSNDRYVHGARGNEHESDPHFSVFMDSNEGSLYWTFEIVSEGIYKIKNGTDYLYKTNEGYVFAGNDALIEADLQWKVLSRQDVIDGLSVAPFPKDATNLITNNYFAYGQDNNNSANMAVKAGTNILSSSPSWFGTSFTDINGYHADVANTNYAAEQWSAEGKYFDNYQTLTDVPNGKYKVSCYGFYRGGGQGYSGTAQNAYLYANSDQVALKSRMEEAVTESDSDKGLIYSVTDNETTKYVPNTISDAAKAFNNGLYKNELNVIVTNNTLTVGVRKTAENTVADDWTTFDNFELSYLGPNLSSYAIALPSGGDMEENTWYYVDVTETGILGFKATDISKIVYTTDGTAFSDVNTALPLNLLNSASTRYYVKSTSANNLVVSKICDNNSYWYLRTGNSSADYQYLSCGGTYNSQAVADRLGLPVCISCTGSNINFQFVDNSHYLFDADNGVFYTDDDTPRDFALEPDNGGFYIVNKNTTANSTNGNKLFIDTSDGNRIKATGGSSTVWTLESVSGNKETEGTHKYQMQKVKDDQAVTAATAAGIDVAGQSITSQATLDSYLDDLYSEPVGITSPENVEEAYEKAAYGNGQYEVYGNPDYTTSHQVTGLRNGLYKLTVQAFERITNNNDTYDNAGGNAGLTYLHANNEKVQLWSVFDFPNNSTYSSDDVQKGDNHYPNGKTSAGEAFTADKYVNEVFVNVTNATNGNDGTLTYGIIIPRKYSGDAATTTRENWVCFKNFTLTYYGPFSESISEGTTYPPAAKFADVTLNRTLNLNKWNTFCVPFAISNEKLKAAFGDDVEVATYSESADGSNSTVTFTKVTPAIAANTPVLLKPSSVSGSNSYSFTGRTIVEVEGTPIVSGSGNYDFVGSYAAQTYVTTGNYYLWDDNKIYKSLSDEGAYISGTRAYIKVKDPVNPVDPVTPVRIVSFVIDDEASGISQIEAEPQKANATYNLKGQKVSGKMGKGIYVVDGKKVVIK